jgi:hypothetical protein
MTTQNGSPSYAESQGHVARESPPHWGVVTPATWFDLDLNPATRVASMGRLMESKVAASAVRPGKEERADLLSLLERTAADAEAAGAVYAAIYSDVLEGRPVSASLIISIVEGRGGPPPPPGTDRAAVAESLGRVLAEAGTVEVRDLPSGPAVRVRKRIQAQATAGEGPVAEAESVQWFVPLPDATRLALLSFSTPTIGLAEPLGELFDAIAGTLSWS